MRFDVVTNIIYHALGFDLSQRNYADLNSATSGKPYLIVKEMSGIWYNLGYINSVCEYEIYDGTGESIFEIAEGQWTLSDLEVKADYYFQVVNVYGKLTDPQGHSTNLLNFGQRYSAVLKAIKKLREMSAFESIEHYNLFTENQKIIKEIERIKNESAEIQNQIDNYM